MKYTKWEHKVISISYDLATNGRILKHMGLDGWQLCAVDDKFFYFKRSLIS